MLYETALSRGGGEREREICRDLIILSERAREGEVKRENEVVLFPVLSFSIEDIIQS